MDDVKRYAQQKDSAQNAAVIRHGQKIKQEDLNKSAKRRIKLTLYFSGRFMLYQNKNLFCYIYVYST
ncbi:hypothetical protein D3Z36_07435 [Lachnospiraceae bacterium]|nr:hypothetical protein [Lachnospiraceae bacterium]